MAKRKSSLLTWPFRILVKYKFVTALALFIGLGWMVVLRNTTQAPAPPPGQIANVCKLFSEKANWYEHADRAYRRWGIPISVQMAIVRQESSFISNAQPPRDWFLGIIPLPRPSSAFGYSQAIDASWDLYRKKSNHKHADRENFADAVDFVGWYCNVTHRTLGIKKTDARRLYLAYHEGHGGYRQRSYRQKAWLMPVAQTVERNAKRYHKQLMACEKSLKMTQTLDYVGRAGRS